MTFKDDKEKIITDIIDLWLETNQFPSEHKSYINRYKKSLVLNIIHIWKFSNEEVDDKKLLEITLKNIAKILDDCNNAIKGFHPFSKINVKYFEALRNSLEILFHYLLNSKFKGS